MWRYNTDYPHKKQHTLFNSVYQTSTTAQTVGQSLSALTHHSRFASEHSNYITKLKGSSRTPTSKDRATGFLNTWHKKNRSVASHCLHTKLNENRPISVRHIYARARNPGHGRDTRDSRSSVTRFVGTRKSTQEGRELLLTRSTGSEAYQGQ